MRVLLCLFIFIVLSACSTDQDYLTKTESPVQISYTPFDASDPPLPFKTFMLDVSYDEGLSYHVGYEQTEQSRKAYILDVNEQHIIGKEAVDHLSPPLNEMNIDQDTEDSVVVKEVIEALNLENNFNKFELEIILPNGAQKEIAVTNEIGSE